MTLPIYASPEQFMRDRSDYARKGIARGRTVVVTIYAGGVLFVAENPSPTLHKVSEIYDRIGFAATGRYNEYENLRTAGIRLADVRGFSYDRRDVTGRWLANAYAQTLGSIFSEHSKPLEVELCVAEVGWPGSAADGSADQLYRISYDGSIADEPHFAVMGGVTEPVVAALDASYTDGWDLPTALRACVAALGAAPSGNGSGTAGGSGTAAGQGRELGANQVEVAVLDRNVMGRTFRRIETPQLTALLGGTADAPPATLDDTAVESAPETRREPNVRQRDDDPAPEGPPVTGTADRANDSTATDGDPPAPTS
ncbi:proteasome subunit alpha [Nakamurella aerolata]|uniref:Proteasome subunit alpha n=1 Tax=Nakamurella aerolata TaxID=1656892 RepID=A0A849A1H3_9ACTN|nr:proteasome subunit alpha [Nakamurella aerolata]